MSERVNRIAMSSLDYHVLLSMASGPLYGYAIKTAVEAESAGTLRPRAGSLYRVLSRLMQSSLVEEVEPPAGSEPHPGQPRRYYCLTARGRRALADEARRQKSAAALAARRLKAAEEHS